MATIKVVEIQNISNQSLDIIYQQSVASNNIGVPSVKTGMLKIKAGSSATLEEARIDLGQLLNLQEKNLIKITHTRV